MWASTYARCTFCSLWRLFESGGISGLGGCFAFSVTVPTQQLIPMLRCVFLLSCTSRQEPLFWLYWALYESATSCCPFHSQSSYTLCHLILIVRFCTQSTVPGPTGSSFAEPQPSQNEVTGLSPQSWSVLCSTRWAGARSISAPPPSSRHWTAWPSTVSCSFPPPFFGFRRSGPALWPWSLLSGPVTLPWISGSDFSTCSTSSVPPYAYHQRCARAVQFLIYEPDAAHFLSSASFCFSELFPTSSDSRSQQLYGPAPVHSVLLPGTSWFGPNCANVSPRKSPYSYSAATSGYASAPTVTKTQLDCSIPFGWLVLGECLSWLCPVWRGLLALMWGKCWRAPCSVTHQVTTNCPSNPPIPPTSSSSYTPPSYPPL